MLALAKLAALREGASTDDHHLQGRQECPESSAPPE